MKRIRYVDSHTGGEPTRTIVAGAPDVDGATVAERRTQLREQHDWLRRAAILEPRGCDWLVGALLLEPSDPKNDAAVIFFNNVGYLGMCGHGLIGVVETLRYLGRASTGLQRIETPVGVVEAVLHEGGDVAIANVVSYRYRANVSVSLPNQPPVVGDIAYGGNWFFLAAEPDVCFRRLEALSRRAAVIRAALQAEGVTGIDGAEIDHIELFGPPSDKTIADSRNFVLCPGGEYDRSPCGTGTSAKVACLAADNQLLPGESWRQESIVGSVFTATYREAENGVRPTIQGRAFVTAEGEMVLAGSDPFRFGVRSEAEHDA